MISILHCHNLFFSTLHYTYLCVGGCTHIYNTVFLQCPTDTIKQRNTIFPSLFQLQLLSPVASTSQLSTSPWSWLLGNGRSCAMLDRRSGECRSALCGDLLLAEPGHSLSLSLSLSLSAPWWEAHT